MVLFGLRPRRDRMGRRDKKNVTSQASLHNDTIETRRVAFKTPATAVLLLRAPEEDILIKACQAIYEFAEEGDLSKVYLMEHGALEPLSQLITHSNNKIRRNALIGLGVMATNGTARTALQNMDVIPSIIDKLSLDDIIVHEFGTLCLSCLSTESCCKVQIIDNNGLPVLINLLSSSDPDVQKNSLDTIYNLVQDLIDLHMETLMVFSNCMSDLDSFRVIQNGGGLSTLMDLLLTPKVSESQAALLKNSNIEIQAVAVKCIANAAQNSDLHPFLHEQKIEKVLVDVLSGGSDNVKAYGCQAFAALSSFSPSKHLFRDLGGIPVVVRLLKSKIPEIIEYATQGLAKLTSGVQLNTMAVFYARGPEILVQRLQDTCPKVLANSITILGRMAGQEAIRCKVVSEGLMRALVEPLKSADIQVLISALLCICELAFEEDARAKLRGADGLEPLVSLLRSSHMEVLRCTCMAISVCAKDEPTALEMCKFGALEILQDITQSINRRSKFTEFALISLLKYNLSLKYGLLGYLATTDLITNGLYDAGKVGFCQKLLTLEELCKEPINQRRPVIVVNAIEMSDDGQQKDEAQSECSQERNRILMDDISLPLLVKEVKESIEPLIEEQEQYIALASTRFVSEIMGGAIEKEELDTFAWLQHLDELRCKLQRNVIPIGMISKGFLCHRALLFKYLSDSIGLRCTLVRGDYNRAWNEVLLHKGEPCSNENFSQPCCYIVDLMHQPGTLLEADSSAALEYESL
ncbi:armadillo repeat-containing protein 3-like isoform X5 [Syngnathoides biaculeatus]|uniref:armadillo repeat-containing protein 3-like isoform X5 n=1 Tax=Syngnathoides biaculeatus TaxID=300417 RepID=UPI002ADDFFBD|nr:armadillo repeat-containing protein 3-like isoform X5 [Syngnathoides biaculeatus]